ncbi:hypothetical protein [Chondromyces apiculatus]|uniref:Uncharacterized protein n=1 Tax=Chondromyces apiculatus DSM 436 TaxID=1192034 RepID=A0A017TBW8_9BACT|nr:hypothetical protein [Chondromyces apiculatus]EYF06315.1 Hypothetical protein CAP_2193 [Chondromyces apiculatus DSM 436]
MAWRTVSRRFVVGVLSSGAAMSFVDRATAATPDAAPTKDEEVTERARALVAPLREGSRFARWTVVHVAPLSRGAVTITVTGEDGKAFRLEVLARDPSPRAPRPPGVTERFAVHVCNGGDGWLPTCEEQGLSAMALAQVIAANEREIDATGFLSYAERIERHREALLPATGHAKG